MSLEAGPTTATGATDVSDPSVANAQLDILAVAAIRGGDSSRYEELVDRHSPRLFGLARKYAHREDDVADLVQEVFLRAYRRLDSWRGDAPFEHWITRLAVNCCYDYLRARRRRPEETMADITDDESAWLERHGSAPEADLNSAAAAHSLVSRILRQLSPASRLVIQLLEIEDRSIKEVSTLTGWNIAVVKVRAFRARAEMRRLIEQLDIRKYL